MLIRTATEADIPTLFDIRTSVRENHRSLEELARIGVTAESIAAMLRKTCRSWIAEEDGYPVAFSMACADEQTVFAMFVRPGHEGQGVGRALMDCAESWLFEQGAAEIWLTTGGDPAIRANGFYRRLGWREAGTLKDGQVRYVKSRR